MKWPKVFSVFIALHLLLWALTHGYKSVYPAEVLVGVDTSFAMTGRYAAMRDWIADYENAARYQSITVVTDKELIGKVNELSSLDSIFRSAFGLSNESSFEKYDHLPASKRFLLSDGRFVMRNWELVEFE